MKALRRNRFKDLLANFLHYLLSKVDVNKFGIRFAFYKKSLMMLRYEDGSTEFFKKQSSKWYSMPGKVPCKKQSSALLHDLVDMMNSHGTRCITFVESPKVITAHKAADYVTELEANNAALAQHYLEAIFTIDKSLKDYNMIEFDEHTCYEMLFNDARIIMHQVMDECKKGLEISIYD